MAESDVALNLKVSVQQDSRPTFVELFQPPEENIPNNLFLSSPEVLTDSYRCVPLVQIVEGAFNFQRPSTEIEKDLAAAVGQIQHCSRALEVKYQDLASSMRHLTEAMAAFGGMETRMKQLESITQELQRIIDDGSVIP